MFERNAIQQSVIHSESSYLYYNVRVRKIIRKGIMAFLLGPCCPVKYDTKEMSMVFQSKETIENNEKRWKIDEKNSRCVSFLNIIYYLCIR